VLLVIKIKCKYKFAKCLYRKTFLKKRPVQLSLVELPPDPNMKGAEDQ
jgi:hypothetical protein